MFHFPVFQLVLNQEPRGEMGRSESGAGPSPCNSHKLSPWPLGDRMAVDLRDPISQGLPGGPVAKTRCSQYRGSHMLQLTVNMPHLKIPCAATKIQGSQINKNFKKILYFKRIICWQNEQTPENFCKQCIFNLKLLAKAHVFQMGYLSWVCSPDFEERVLKIEVCCK